MPWDAMLFRDLLIWDTTSLTAFFKARCSKMQYCCCSSLLIIAVALFCALSNSILTFFEIWRKHICTVVEMYALQGFLQVQENNLHTVFNPFVRVLNVLLAFLDCVQSWCFQKTVNVDPKVSFLGHDFQFRVQQMWFRIRCPWHIILHLFTLKLKNLVLSENLEIPLQTSTPNHWWKYWMKPVPTLIYGEYTGDSFPPRKWTWFPSFNLTSNQKKEPFLLQCTLLNLISRLAKDISKLQTYSVHPIPLIYLLFKISSNTSRFLGVFSFYRSHSDSFLTDYVYPSFHYNSVFIF